jgi:hypothetical protein
LSGIGSKTRRIASADSTDANIRQYSILPALRWQWTPEADLSLIYRYYHVKRENEDQTAQSHTIHLVFTYAWNKFSISR